jgi:MraZ protein
LVWERAEDVESEIFQGNALNAVDAKSRLSVPAFIRSVIDRASDSRAVYIGAHGRMPCLTVYGVSYAEYLVGELDRMRLRDEDHGGDPDALEDRERGLFGMTERVNYDSGGRIVLNPLLREEARIDDLALFVGRGRFVEMWNPSVAVELGGEKLKKIASFYLKQRGGKA